MIYYDIIMIHGLFFEANQVGFEKKWDGFWARPNGKSHSQTVRIPWKITRRDQDAGSALGKSTLVQDRNNLLGWEASSASL